MTTSIAIIGMGSVGNGILWSIVDSGLAQQIGRIDIYDPTNDPGVGYPYSQANVTCLVNRQARYMSVRLAQDADLIKWIDLHADLPLGFPYLDRAQYGLYLRNRFHEAVRFLREKNVEVQHAAVEVTEVWPLAGGAGLNHENGSATYDAVILTMGYGLPSNVSPSGMHPNAILPYPTTQLRELAHHARLAVIVGTGLTGIDSARVILDASEDIQVNFLSRSDTFPDVRAHSEELLVNMPPVPSDAHPATAEGLRRYLNDCISQAGVPRNTLTSVTQRLMSGLAGVVTNDQIPLDEQLCQGVMTSVANSEIDRIWARMPSTERAAFTANGHRLFQAMANPIPPASAAALVTARNSGRITSTKCRSVLPPLGADKTLVIDASNTWRLGLDTSETMLRANGFKMGKNGYGVHIDADGRLVHKSIPSHRVFATGMIRRGSSYYYSSLYKSLELGDQIIHSIMCRLKGKAR